MKEKTGVCRKGGRWLLSLFIVCMMRYTVSGGLMDTEISDMAGRMLGAFSQNTFVDLLLFVGVFLLLNKEKDAFGRFDGWTVFSAVFCALLYVLGLCCRSMGGFLILLSHKPQLFMFFLAVAAYAILFCYGLRLIWLWMENADIRDPAGDRRFPVCKAAAVIFLCWLPWLLMNYPCSFCVDSIWQMSQWVGVRPWSNHHPVLSTAVMGLCWSIGKTLINENFGVFLYCLLQSVLGAFVFACCIREMYVSALSKRFCRLMLAFYALTPIWGLCVQWFEKDFLYTVVFTAAMTLLLPVLRDRDCSPRRAACIGAVALLASLLRHSGSLELFPLLFAAALWLRKPAGKRLLAAAVSVLLLSVLIENAAYPALGVQKGSKKEMLSLPFQQTARYCLVYPEEVTQEEHDAIDAVLVYDQFYNYDPDSSDAIKETYRGNDAALPAYLRVWFQMFCKHPANYFETWFSNHYLDLAPVAPSLNLEIMSSYGATGELLGVYRVFSLMPTRLFVILRDAFLQLPLLSILASPGAYTWVLWVCVIQMLRKKRYSDLIITLPCLVNVLYCTASPLNGAMRYELPTVALIPVIIGWTLICPQNNGDVSRMKNAECEGIT